MANHFQMRSLISGLATDPALAVCVLPGAASAQTQAVNYTVRIDAPRDLRELLEDNLDLVRWRGNRNTEADAFWKRIS